MKKKVSGKPVGAFLRSQEILQRPFRLKQQIHRASHSKSCLQIQDVSGLALYCRRFPTACSQVHLYNTYDKYLSVRKNSLSQV